MPIKASTTRSKSVTELVRPHELEPIPTSTYLNLDDQSQIQPALDESIIVPEVIYQNTSGLSFRVDHDSL